MSSRCAPGCCRGLDASPRAYIRCALSALPHSPRPGSPPDGSTPTSTPPSSPGTLPPALCWSGKQAADSPIGKGSPGTRAITASPVWPLTATCTSCYLVCLDKEGSQPVMSDSQRDSDQHIRLFIPGPTEVRPEILDAQTRWMIGHRMPEAAELFGRVQEKLRQVFLTESRVYVTASSGTGWQEGAVRNLVARKALNCVNGA